MALKPQEVAEVMRQRLNLPEEDTNRILIAIPEALKRLGRKVAMDEKLRDLLISDKSTVTGAITTGKVDLSALEASARIMLEFLDKGQIYHTSSTLPLRRMSPLLGQVAGTYMGTNANFVMYYTEGKYLVLVDAALTGSLSFAVPTYPGTVAQLPASDEVHVMFFDTLAELLGNVAADYSDNRKPQ